jgi:8-oxo-dGTP diphosphatase
LKEIIYATTNTGKLNYMKKMIKELDIKIYALSDYKESETINSIHESGKTPIENAQIKAVYYYKYFKRPLFSCDSGLYIEGLPVEKQPGVNVRRVNGKKLNDEEMIEYYSSLISKLGGKVVAQYIKAIYCVIDKNKIFSYSGESISKKFILTDLPHKKRIKGFPLDSLSMDINSNKYYFDLTENENGDKVSSGFKAFFEKILSYL